MSILSGSGMSLLEGMWRLGVQPVSGGSTARCPVRGDLGGKHGCLGVSGVACARKGAIGGGHRAGGGPGGGFPPQLGNANTVKS